MESQRVSQSAPTPAAHAAQPAHAALRSKAQQGGAPQCSAGAGFSALLDALGGDALAAVQAWAGADTGAAAALAPGAASTAADALAPGAAALPPGLAEAAWGAQLLAQGGLVAETTRIDAAVEQPGAAPGEEGTVALFGRGGRGAQPALAPAAQGGEAWWAPTRGPRAAPAQAHSGAAGAGDTAPPALLSAAALQRDAAAAAAAAPSAPAHRADSAAAPAQAPPLAALDTAAPWAAAAPRPGERGAGTADSAWGGGGTGAQVQARPDAAAPADGAPVPDLQETVAEQVAYWMGENLQNAELTLTHEGLPVEVSVSLAGKEAHVAFRSDEGATRDLLDAGADQLRAMLGSEGLVLSGMSVASSGARHGGAGEAARGRNAARQAQVQALVPAGAGGAAPAPGRPGVLTERKVDLFV